MRNAILGLFLLIICSCNTAKWCYNHCPAETKDSLIYITTEKVVKRDTLIYIPGDTIVMKDSVPCNDFSKEFGNNKTKVKVVVKDKILTVEVINGAVQIKADLFDHYKTIYEKQFHSETHKGVVKHKMWLSFWESWICLGILLFSLIRFLLKTFKLKIVFVPAFPFISVVPKVSVIK